jgi:ATP-dependent helicase/nuclease subunit B
MEIYNKLFEILSPYDLLLTGNKRLIPCLYKAYAHYQQKQCWRTLKLFTLTRWLESLWEKQLIEHAAFSFRLLTKQQECIIWQTIIKQSSYFLIDTPHTAKNAQQAWQLLRQAQLDYQSPVFKQSNETETWQTWATTFARFSQSHATVDLSTAIDHLILLFRKKILTAPKRIVLIGFTEINPQYKKLLTCLKEQQCDICYYTPVYPQAKVHRLAIS